MRCLNIMSLWCPFKILEPFVTIIQTLQAVEKVCYYVK